MKLDREKVEELLACVFDELQTSGDNEQQLKVKRQFIFHMTDWLNDLEKLVELYEEPQQSCREASTKIAGFLYHVVPHLNAAGRLLLDRIPDPFDGSTSRDSTRG